MAGNVAAGDGRCTVYDQESMESLRRANEAWEERVTKSLQRAPEREAA